MSKKAQFHFVATDLLPSFFFTFESEDDAGAVTPIDLTLYSSIVLRLRREDGTLVTVNATIDDAANGKGHFEWASGDLTEGVHEAEIVRTLLADGDTETIPAESPMIFNTRSKV